MKKKRFSVEQMASVLQQAAGRVAVGDVCRRVGIFEQTFYRWKQAYGGMLPGEARELNQLREENTKLKREERTLRICLSHHGWTSSACLRCDLLGRQT